MNQMMFQRACAWSGIACITLFTVAFVIAGFIPPLSPSLSPDEVAAHYRDHATGIRIGAVVMLISSMFYAWFTAVMSGQMRRIPGVHPTVVYAQLAAGALACVTFMLPAMLFVVASFRPERAPELTQILNDLSWIVLVMPWPPFMAQNFAFAFAIFSDKRETPLFPRWARLPQHLGADHLLAIGVAPLLQERAVRMERDLRDLDSVHRVHRSVRGEHHHAAQGDPLRSRARRRLERGG